MIERATSSKAKSMIYLESASNICYMVMKQITNTREIM